MIALIPLAFALPLPTIFLLLIAFDVRKSPVVSSFVVGLSLACAFYGLQLSSASDIFRHMAFLQAYARVDFFHCFDAGHYSMLYVWDIWCWLISRLNSPYLLQCSAAFVGYSLIAYIAFDYSARRDVSRSIAAIALLFGVCSIPFAEVFIGIRSTIALILCALAAYRRFVCGDNIYISILICAAAAMIHQVSLLASILICVARPLARSPRIGLTICFLVAFLAANICSYLLPSIDGSSNPLLDYLSGAFRSFLGYSGGNDWTRMQSSSLNTRINTLFTFLWIVLLFVNVYVSRRASLQSPYIGVALSLSVVDALVLAGSVIMVGLSLVLDVNGTRLVAFVFSLGLVPLIDRMKVLPASSNKSMFILDALCWTVVAGLFALHSYSLYYGCQDFPAFLTTLALGAVGSLWGCSV